MFAFHTIEWCQDSVRLLDQTQLPHREVYRQITTIQQMAEAINNLRIRGAPAIGIAAAYGLVLSAQNTQTRNITDFKTELRDLADLLIATRPTAVNLTWAISRMLAIADKSDQLPIEEILPLLEQEAIAIHQEDKILCKKIGEYGAEYIQQVPVNILTHCNAGALATGGQGTALSVIYEIANQNREVHVFVDETRPLLQGARLTTWELHKSGIPVTLICDNMAAALLSQHRIDCALVGADRIAANGDTANKIGTFSLALAAAVFTVPFYVAAPHSTFDLNIDSGEQIPIEIRNSAEISQFAGQIIAPQGISFYNPAFDVTPNRFVTAFITDKGIIHPPFFENLKKVKFKS